MICIKSSNYQAHFEMDRMGSERHQNTSKGIVFDAGMFPGGKQGDSRRFVRGKTKGYHIWLWVIEGWPQGVT